MRKTIKIVNAKGQKINKEINNIEAAKLIGISRGTFFRLIKERKSLKG